MRLRPAALLLMAGTLVAVIAGQTPATAQTPPPSQPVAQPFTECYSNCTSPALLRSATPTARMLLPASSPARATINFELRADGGPSIATGGSGFVSPGNVATWQIPDGILQTGLSYRLRAFSADEGGKRSDWTDWVMFAIDLDRPQAPTVHSDQYPEQQWGAVLGTPGTFDVAGSSADVAAFVWHLLTGPYATVTAEGSLPRTATVTTTPPNDGPEVFSVYAIDAAGNISDTVNYTFYVSPPPDLYAHWAFDETDGTVAADTGNLGLPGTLTGAAAFAPGYVNGGNAVSLDGGLVTTATAALDLTKSYTVMGWVYLNDPSLGRQSILSQGDLMLGFDPAANGGAGGWCVTVLSVSACSDGSQVGPPVGGQWTHVAARYDAVTHELAVFVMGDPESCGGERIATAFSGSPAAGNAFLIGQSNTTGEPWHGLIDDVYAYQRALAGVEICQHALA